MTNPTIRQLRFTNPTTFLLLLATSVVLTILPARLGTAADRQHLPAGRAAATVHASSPKPINPDAVVEFDVEGDAGRTYDVRVTVHDLAGRTVASLGRSRLAPGTYERNWSGTDRRGASVGAGVYFVSVRVAGQATSRKTVVVR